MSIPLPARQCAARTVTVLLAPVLALALAACGSTPAPEPSPTGPVTGADCVEDLAVKNVVFGQDIDAELAGLILGSGSTGVVLAHQNGGDVCQWLPYGEELAQKGYRVLLFDFAGFGISPSSNTDIAEQVAAAAAELRKDGASNIVLIGASMGGTASLVAATTVTPPVSAVVSISAPDTFGSANATGTIATLEAPVLLLAGRGDSHYARSAELLHSLAPAGKSTLLIAESGDHGWPLVTVGLAQDSVRTAVFDFLAKHAPAA